MNFIKIKNLCASKSTIWKLRRQATDLEKIVANHIHVIKDLNPEYIKKLHLTDKVTHNPILKKGKNLNRYFIKER